MCSRGKGGSFPFCPKGELSPAQGTTSGWGMLPVCSWGVLPAAGRCVLSIQPAPCYFHCCQIHSHGFQGWFGGSREHPDLIPGKSSRREWAGATPSVGAASPAVWTRSWGVSWRARGQAGAASAPGQEQVQLCGLCVSLVSDSAPRFWEGESSEWVVPGPCWPDLQL